MSTGTTCAWHLARTLRGVPVAGWPRRGGRLTPFVVPGHEAAHWADFQRETTALNDALRAPLDVVEGFEAWPRAFRGLFTGDKGIGKRVVRLG